MKQLVKYLFFVCFILNSTRVDAQALYNNCNQALEVCANNSFTINNINANKTFCTDCEDDFSNCFTPQNTIWLKFKTNNLGGNGLIQFTNLIFQNSVGQDNDLNAFVLEAIQPCASNTYTQIGSCITNQTNDFDINLTGLIANTVYYIVLSGDLNGTGVTKAAEFTSDVMISGSGIDLPTPSLALFTDSLNVCQNQVVSFYAGITNCPDSTAYQWFINDSLITTIDTNYFETSTIDSGDVVSVSTTCYQDCIVTIKDSTNPFIINSFKVDAGKDRTIDKAMTIQLNGQGNASIYEWQPQDLVTNNLILQPIAFPNETTTFTLMGEKNGCKRYDYVTITIESELIIPSSFSPNFDGVNDVFEIVGIEQYPNCFIRIYDRWGEEVFQKIAYSYESAWDGKLLGKVIPGVYFYVLELRDSEKQVKKGSVTVLK